MSLYISSINSGSNGNCYYVGNQSEAVLIDAGISCREIEKRMKRLGLNMQKVKAIFVSHEHSDHIKGINSLCKKYRLPVYITEPACLQSGLLLDGEIKRSFAAHEPVVIGSLSITAFPKLHDACDPYSFVIDCNGVKAGVFTDIGFACPHVISYFQQCHAVFLEANYDEDMLNNGSYPYHLKQRIRGGNGHLSNRQALGLFTAHKPSFMTHILLSHLSKNNNCPDLVGSLFRNHANGVQVVIASRYQESEVYHISHTTKNTKSRSSKTINRLQLQFQFA